MGSNTFGNYLRYLIKKAGMTQTQFYTALGITKPYFYDILSGKVSPPPPELQFKATPQNTQKERPCGKIPPGRAYIRHSISAAAALI